MQTIQINGRSGESRILVGESLDNLHRYIPQGRAVIVTDTTVAELYGDRFPPYPTGVIGSGESAKSLETVSEIYRRLIELEADRDTFVVGIGGGVVCDVTGFAAATYMRGLSYGFAATTLLAQVDASVGGKNGVNFGGYKNMVGLFNQPEFVLCDPSVLTTLAPAEIANGLAEVVKHALIADRAAFEHLESHADAVLALKPGAIEKTIFESVSLKAGIVARDELEQGERRKLNFGHTFGHAVESAVGLHHGAAVSIGMAAAAALSVKRGLLAADDAGRISALLERLGLPTKFPGKLHELREALRRDKKRSGSKIHFVLLAGIGEAVLEELPLEEVEEICMTDQIRD